MGAPTLSAVLGGDALAVRIIDALARHPREPLFEDIGGEIEASVASDGEQRRCHVGYGLGGAFDVAGRVAPRRREVEKVRVIAEATLGDQPGLTGLVGVVRDGDHPRVKLYVARGVQADPAALRRYAAALARHLKLEPPAFPPTGTTDEEAVEFHIAGGMRLKPYQTWPDPAPVRPRLAPADQARLDALWAARPRDLGRCPVMVTQRGDRATAVQVRVDPARLGDLSFAPPAPAGTTPTYVGLHLGQDRATTYFLLPGAPLDRGKAPAEAAPVAPPPMPKAIDLSIGETCNNNCTFCINPTETWAPLAETSRLLRTIEQCAAQGYERLSFLGGEPTLHPALPQLIRHAYAHGFHEVMLVTNGRKLADPAFAAEVAQAGIRRALFMLLSHDPAVHDGITRKPGSLAAALQGVVTARAAGIDVCANIPITRSNVGQLSETVAALVERGITQICFLYLTAYGNVLSHPGVLAPYDQAAVELRRACAEHDHHAELLIDNFPFCYLPGLEDRIQSEMANPWREIAYPSGSIVDVAEVYRFRKMRLPECDGCRWDAVCGGVQDTAQLDQIATELAQGLRRMRQLRGAPAE